MKQCPQCNRTYADDLMRFCLSDGTPLIPVYNEAEEVTVASPSPAIQVPAARGVSPWFKYLTFGLLFFVLGSTVALWLISRSLYPRPSEVSGNTAVKSPTPTAEKAPAVEPKADAEADKEAVAKEAQRQAEELKKRQEAQKPPEPAAKTPSPKPVTDPQTTRITFRRGSVGETVSGTIAEERGYVLYTLDGQNLSARVSSPDECVTFTNGSTTARFTTAAGDTRLQLENNCDEPVNFRMAVTVR